VSRVKKWKWLVIGVFLVLGLAVAVYGFKDILRPASPKPYQEVADALAEYGWEVKDLEVNTIKRTMMIVAIPPEDDEGYISGFFYILEWADEIIKPPLSEGKPVPGIFPGVLIIVELTPDGPRVLLSNGKAAQACGTKRIMALVWEAVDTFLGEQPSGAPWREHFDNPGKIRQGVYQLSWYRKAQYVEYGTPSAYAVLENGWYAEEPEVELLDEPKT